MYTDTAASYALETSKGIHSRLNRGLFELDNEVTCSYVCLFTYSSIVV